MKETIEILELKIKKLEQLVKLKDAKISNLTNKLQTAGIIPWELYDLVISKSKEDDMANKIYKWISYRLSDYNGYRESWISS
jgi:hypothetical protein